MQYIGYHELQKIAKFDITKKFLGFFRGKKSVIADKNNTDKVCHIYVYGFMHNSGATHFCLCFASFLKERNGMLYVSGIMTHQITGQLQTKEHYVTVYIQ